MTFHKEGYPSLFAVILFGIGLNLLTQSFFPNTLIIHILSYALSIFFFVAILQFFRSPSRNFQPKENEIISPADGTIVVIEEVEETEYFNDKRLQVSIFMSPTNIHLNRYPISGIIKYFKYHAGKHLVAWHPKSSSDNEQTTIVVENKKKQEVLYRQIAGFLARRIVFFGKKGDTIQQTDECGFIKFGSRVDLLLPLGVELTVALNDKVKGGIDTIAIFK